MGKKSLLKSTSKKKKDAKKVNAGEQIESPEPESKKAAPKTPAAQEPVKKPDGKTASPETHPKAKPTAKKQPPSVEPKAAAKQAPKASKDAPAKKPLTVAELLALKFDVWKPDFSQAQTTPLAGNYTAPAFVDSSDQEKADRIRRLLALKFDMEAIVAAAKEPQPQIVEPVKTAPPPQKQPAPAEANEQSAKPAGEAIERKPLSVAELLALKFDIWKPDFSQAPEATRADDAYTAPPIVDPSDNENADRIRGLLALQFDMEAIIAAAQEPQPQIVAPAKLEVTGDTKPIDAVLRPLPRACPSGQTLAYPVGKKSILGNKLFQVVLGIGLVYLVLIYASAVNKQRFFIKPTYKSVKIYQGTFSPAGKRLVVEIPGIHAPEPIKKSYTREEVFPLFQQFYTDLALRQLEVTQLLDLPAIQAGLENISAYAVTEKQKALVQKQMDTLEFISLLYKADVAANAGEIKVARKYLNKAEGLALDNEEALLVKNKLAAIDALLDK